MASRRKPSPAAEPVPVPVPTGPSVCNLDEQSDGRWLIIRVRNNQYTHMGWIADERAIVGSITHEGKALIDIIADGIRAKGVTVNVVPKHMQKEES